MGSFSELNRPQQGLPEGEGGYPGRGTPATTETFWQQYSPLFTFFGGLIVRANF